MLPLMAAVDAVTAVPGILIMTSSAPRSVRKLRVPRSHLRIRHLWLGLPGGQRFSSPAARARSTGTSRGRDMRRTRHKVIMIAAVRM
jgi:hypothetical protein